jgi:hypothetical protein
MTLVVPVQLRAAFNLRSGLTAGRQRFLQGLSPQAARKFQSDSRRMPKELHRSPVRIRAAPPNFLYGAVAQR